MIHVIVLEHSTPACYMEVPEPSQVIIYLIAKSAIANLKQRISLWGPDHCAVNNLTPLYKTKGLKVINSNIRQHFIRRVPGFIAPEAEKFHHDYCFAFRRHFLAPVRRLMYSAERDSLLRDVDPCLVRDPSP